MNEKVTIEITVVGDKKFYVYESDMNTMGVPDNPTTWVAQHIGGSRGPLLRVNTLEDLTGEVHYINPQMIVSARITYK
jgi:hypothetical protein